jgi:hypothetical protein
MLETRSFYRFHGELWFYSDFNRFIVLILLQGTLIISQFHDNMIIEGPCYISAWLCRMTLQMFGINTVPLHTHEAEGFLPSASLAESLITKWTKAIVLVTPNNPVSARVFSLFSSEILISIPQDWSDIPSCASPRFCIFVQQTPHRTNFRRNLPRFSHTTKRSPARSIRQVTPLGLEATHNSSLSFSKGYAIPGHRVGAVAAGPEVIKSVITVLDNIQVFSQYRLVDDEISSALVP